VLSDLSPARRRFVLAGLAVPVAAVVAVVGVALGRGGDHVDPVPQAVPGPVLLVTGYGGGRASLDVLADALRHAGRDVTVVDPVGDGTGDLRAQARALAATAERTLRRTGARTVDVVGYSAGGVVARLWVADDGGDRVARRVVTLSSPSHGTALAAAGVDVAGTACPTACRQLAPDSGLLRALNRGDETPAGPRWVAIWTTDDEVVVPPTSGRLDGALGFAVQDVCPGAVVAHGDVPRSPSVVAIVRAELGTALPSRPSGAVCEAGAPSP
jgi:triacylglycerol esterase/lipase EstA (alpha/beta hydrolase family)